MQPEDASYQGPPDTPRQNSFGDARPETPPQGQPPSPYKLLDHHQHDDLPNGEDPALTERPSLYIAAQAQAAALHAASAQAVQDAVRGSVQQASAAAGSLLPYPQAASGNDNSHYDQKPAGKFLQTPHVAPADFSKPSAQGQVVTSAHVETFQPSKILQRDILQATDFPELQDRQKSQLTKRNKKRKKKVQGTSGQAKATAAEASNSEMASNTANAGSFSALASMQDTKEGTDAAPAR